LRYIDSRSLRDKLPEGWEARATAALAAVRSAAPSERRIVIERHASVWHELKNVLAELSYGKCWYCESEQVRSDNAVDHFRPKRQVAEAVNHDGYWWLAFEYTNYRFSCQFCNSRRKDSETGQTGGKHDHFPLLNETARAYKEGDNWAREQPMLLDPTRVSDTTLLWFEPDGRVVEKYEKENSPVFHERAKVSIWLYHLNEARAKRKRRDLQKEIVDLIDEGNAHFREFEAGNAAAELAYASVIRRIQSRLEPRSEYSAAARAMLLAYRDADHPWVEAVLTVM